MHVSFPRVFLVAGLVGLSGCAAYTPKWLSASSSAAAFDSRSLNSTELRAALEVEGIAVKSRWSLTQLTAAASHLNPELAVLRAKMKTAEAALQTAGERPNPSFSFKPGYNSSSASGITPWIIEPGLDIPIETGDKREARMAVAVAKLRGARLDFIAGIWKVRAEIRRALLAMHAAQATGEKYQSQEAIQSEAAGLLESQLREGAVSAQDVVSARIPLNQTRVSMHDSRLLAAKSRGQLAAATGVPVSALDGIEIDFAEVTRLPSVPTGRRARSRALVYRADILSGLANYAASEESLRLEVAKQYPDIKLGPSYKLDQTANKWTFGVGFEIPLLNQHRGAIAEAENRREEAAAQFVAVQARALAEIDNALAVYQAARGKSEASAELSTDVKKRITLAETMTEDGEISGLEVTQRRLEQGAADLTRDQALIQAYEAAGALEDAMQTPDSLWK